METVRPKVAVSRCLLGEPVRYNRGHSRSRFLTDRLSRYVDWVGVCPEIEIGLGAPRQTLRLLADDHLVSRDGSSDHTAAMAALARRRGPDLAEVDGYVLKSRSPSCGLAGIPRYDGDKPGDKPGGKPGGKPGDQPADRKGTGAFAARIVERFPLLPMEEDGRLNDPFLREWFVERIFAHARLRQLFTGGWSPRDLVEFHSRHKLQILAHDPARYNELGVVVAMAGTGDRDRLRERYTRVFGAAFAVRAQRGCQVNALQHLFGPMSRNLDLARRRDLVEVIEDFGAGLVPLSVPIALLKHDARGTANGYLQDQTYLEPFPAELALRNHV